MPATHKPNVLFWLFVLGALYFALSPTADARQPFHSRSPRPYFYHHPSPAAIQLHFAGNLYYYDEGAYFRHTPAGFASVRAPAGVVIHVLPKRHKRIAHNHTTYYIYDNTYYVKEPQGYVVVNPPVEAIKLNTAAVEAPEKTVIVNVPNPNGSYIPVTLQKYSDGYIGPRGEFYPDYPTLDQLKAMYSIQSQSAASPSEPEELVIHVANANGSYTKVKLIKSEEGYVGPEGEYYPQKPTKEQLKVLYSKS